MMKYWIGQPLTIRTTPSIRATPTDTATVRRRPNA
jgi:hypothetical protein